MKRSYLFALLAMTWATQAFSAPCSSGTLASYLSSTTGCTVGSDTFSKFTLPTGTTGGASELNPSSVTLSFSGTSLEPQITATLSDSVVAGGLDELLFGYQISGASFVGETITLSGSSETADGAVTDVQNFCEGGSFGSDGISGCPGTTGTLLTLDGTQNTDSTVLGASLISVSDDLVLDGGLAGSASGAKITDRFSAVPEPSTLLAMGLILGTAAFLPRRRRS